MIQYQFTSTVIRWQSDGATAWHFVPLPTDLAEEIHRIGGSLKAGWGSIRVEVTIGSTTWKTSIFPNKSGGNFLLPLKAAVRKSEGLAEGDAVDVTISL